MGGGPSDGERLALGFLAVRRAVGYVGISVPIVLLAGGWIVFGTGQQPTISDYHGTGMRDVFVGLLCAVGVFLWAYRGYGARDWYASRFAGTFALLVAVFPNTGQANMVHLPAAALFFVTLALMSLFLFTKSSRIKTDRPPGKRRRNVVYIVCGWGILACLALIAVYSLWLKGSAAWLDGIGPIFWLEAIAIWFFGASWLVKGEFLQRGVTPKRVRDYFDQDVAGAGRA